MTMRHRLDPELVAPLDAWQTATKGGINLHDIPATRKMMDELAAGLEFLVGISLAPKNGARAQCGWIGWRGAHAAPA